MSAIKVSVIVPCYNQAKYLAETLDSVFVQTYDNWECIIVNDGSADNTGEIAEDYCKRDSRFRYISQNNSGVSATRNNGITAAFGYYILPLDADDRIHPDFLLKAVALFARNKKVKLIYSDAAMFGTEQGIWRLPAYKYERLLVQNLFFCTALFKKADFIKAGMYDVEMHTGLEDWEFWIRFLNETDTVQKLDDIYFFYRIKPSSRNQLSKQANNEIRYNIYLKHLATYKKHFPNPLDLIVDNWQLTTMYKNSSNYKLGSKILNPIRFIVNAIKSIVK
jgi:glycosyltransferase involved in cell wall biosynthesis